MRDLKFLVLATEGITTNLLCEKLRQFGKIELLVLEEPESVKTKLRRRLRKLPFGTVISQVLFLSFILPFLKIGSAKKHRDLIKRYGLGGQLPTDIPIARIESVNSDQLFHTIQNCNVDYIFVNGTRIIHKNTLLKLDKPILNIHVGITPQYRGIHGGYWALYQKDAENFGVTLHYVDAGVDTGKAIARKRFFPDNRENFVTYPIHQYLEGLKLAENFFNQHILPEEEEGNKGAGCQHYHPGFFQYLGARWFRGIR